MMLVFAGAFALAMLLVAGFAFQRRGSWVVLGLTFLSIPVALFVSLWATGIGHPSGKLYLAKLFLPYMVLPFTVPLITSDQVAGIVCFWLPLFQVLIYGIVLAGGYARDRLWQYAAWLVGIHVLASALAFTFHHSGYLDGK